MLRLTTSFRDEPLKKRPLFINNVETPPKGVSNPLKKSVRFLSINY